MRPQTALLLSTSLVLSLFVSCPSLKATNGLPPELQEQSPPLNVNMPSSSQSNDEANLHSLLTSPSLPETNGTEVRKRKRDDSKEKEKGLEDNAPEAQPSTSSSTSRPIPTEQSKKPRIKICLFGKNADALIAELIPPSMQVKTFTDVRRYFTENPLTTPSLNEMIKRFNAIVPSKNESTLESFNKCLQLLILFENMYQKLDQKFHEDELGMDYSLRRIEEMHQAHMSLLQFYVNTFYPIPHIYKRLNKPSKSSMDNQYKKAIIPHSMALEKLVSTSRIFRGKEATAEDYQLFGQAYDVLVDAFTYKKRDRDSTGVLIHNYFRNAVEMYSKMLNCLKESTTPEHLSLAASAYKKLGYDYILIDGSEDNLKSMKYYTKSGEHYSKIIELLGPQATPRNYKDAARAFLKVSELLMENLPDEATPAEIGKPVSFFMKSFSFYSEALRRQQLSFADISTISYEDKMFDILWHWRPAEGFAREHGHIDEANQLKAFIDELSMPKKRDVKKIY